MLQVFCLDVAYVCNGFQLFSGVFASIQTHISSVSSVFRRMLQVLHLDVSKVDQVLHVLQCNPPAVAVGGVARGWAGRRYRVGSSRGAKRHAGRVGRTRCVGSCDMQNSSAGIGCMHGRSVQIFEG
jgi:hypothetical protein